MTVAILTKEMFSEPLSLTENGWLTVAKQTEFGDYNDNLSVYLTALYAIRRGFQKEGLLVIQNLRSQIVATGEAKSNEWLLPKLNSLFDSLSAHQLTSDARQ